MKLPKILLLTFTLLCNQSYGFIFWGNSKQEDREYFRNLLNGLQNKERLTKQLKHAMYKDLDLYSLLTYCNHRIAVDKGHSDGKRAMCLIGQNELDAVIDAIKAKNSLDPRLVYLKHAKSKADAMDFDSIKKSY